MPSREPTREDMLEALRLKAAADGASDVAQNAALDADKKRVAAQQTLDSRIKAIEVEKTAEVDAAKAVYDKALVAVDKALKTAYDKLTKAQEAVQAHKEAIQEQTGAIIDLAGSGSRSRSTHL